MTISDSVLLDNTIQWLINDACLHFGKIDSPNTGEVIWTTRYRTMMVGKWHCAGVPFERDSDRHFGFMGNGTDFFLGDEAFKARAIHTEQNTDDQPAYNDGETMALRGLRLRVRL